MRKNNKFIIFILILFISIGFAYLSTNLYINGTSIVKRTTWSVYFDNVNNESTTGEINTNASISTDKKEVDFEITFDKPGDTYTFNVDVVNDGTLDAMLESFKIEGLEEQADYMNWYVLYDDGIRFSKYDLLKAGTTEKILITVSIKEDVDIDYLPTTEVVSSNLKFTANYVQADQNGKERERRTYNIRYNLDGGTISNNPTTYNSRLGATIPNPTKEGYTFAGWTGGKNLVNILDHNESFQSRYYYETFSIPSYILEANTQYALSFYHVINDIDRSESDIYYSIGYGTSEYLVDIQTYINYTDASAVEKTTFKTPTTFAYTQPQIAFRFTRLKTPGSVDVDISNIQLEKGTKATEYEPYISEPVTDIVLSPGATGNRTYTANWIEN